ncbi:MAG: hypothetical protein ACPLXP_02455 [Microgenomates group bacterium]
MTKKLMFLLFFFPSLVLAQEFNFNRALSDYLYNYDLYREAHQRYISAREAYLQYKTLTSKTNLLRQTLEMTRARDEVMRTYLIALKMRLNESPGISVYERNTLNLKLDNEIDWYTKHKEELSSAAILEDLVELAKKAEERYRGKTEILIYQTLHKILVGKETALRERISGQIETIRKKLKEISEKGDKNTLLAERWLLEAESRLLRFEEKINLSEQRIEKLETSFYSDNSQVYKESQLLLEEAHQYLKEANRYLKEIIREVKTADGNY